MPLNDRNGSLEVDVIGKCPSSLYIYCSCIKTIILITIYSIYQLENSSCVRLLPLKSYTNVRPLYLKTSFNTTEPGKKEVLSLSNLLLLLIFAILIVSLSLSLSIGYFLMQCELCPYGNLNSFMHALDTRLPENTLWKILSDVAKGLSYIHDAGIIHLDIKPQNIFISRTGTLKIGDFGSAIEGGRNEDDESEGDTYYMAKELLNTRERLPSADIFSLGIMLFELASSISSHNSSISSSDAVLSLPQEGPYWHKLRDNQAPRIPNLYSDALDGIIRQMMQSDPLLRPTAQTILSSIPSHCSQDVFIQQNAFREIGVLMPITTTSSSSTRQTLFENLSPVVEQERSSGGADYNNNNMMQCPFPTWAG